jgi:hypothetical protein
MKTYARVESGRIAEIIAPVQYGVDSPEGVEPPYKAEDEIPIELRFHPSFVNTLIDVSGASPSPEQGWSAKNVSGEWSFGPYEAPSLSGEEIVAANTVTQSALMDAADAATFGMADAFVIGQLNAADAEKFKAWATYKLALSKVDLSQTTPAWPQPPV